MATESSPRRRQLSHRVYSEVEFFTHYSVCAASGRGDTFGGGYIDNYWYREDEPKDEEVLLAS